MQNFGTLGQMTSLSSRRFALNMLSVILSIFVLRVSTPGQTSEAQDMGFFIRGTLSFRVLVSLWAKYPITEMEEKIFEFFQNLSIIPQRYH